MRIELRNWTVAAWLACILWAPVAAAQSDNAGPIDLSRLHWTSGDHLLVGFPARLGVSYGHVSPISMKLWTDEGLRQREADDLGMLHLTLSPRIIATGNTWPIFQHYMGQLEVQARQFVTDVNLSGVSAYDPEREYRTGWEEMRLVQAFVQAAGDALAVKIGLTRSDWGAGILANGNEDSRPGAFTSPFGAARFADSYLRAQVAAFPMGKARRGDSTIRPLTVAIAGDMTIDDANSNWFLGDRTYTAIGAIRAQFGPFSGGVYVAHRVQNHAQGGRTEVTAADLLAELRFRFGKTRLRLLSELAIVVGNTDYAQSVSIDGPYDVLAHGGVARLGLEHGIFEGVVEAGWASGDENPYDGTLRSFSFNPGFRVGVLLFSEALKTSAAASATNISDPVLRDAVPRAFDRVSHRGVVRDAMYLNPRVALKPIPRLTLMAGVVYARSVGDYTDPFWSAINGGVSTGPNGASAVQDLGYEIDLGIHAAFDLRGAKLGLRAEFAFFDPGSVFSSSTGEEAANVYGAALYLEVQL